jgi:hypothetical protein
MLDVAAFETGGTFDPNSTNPKSKAAGLFQFVKETWEELASQYGFTDPYDIDQNAQAGAIYLSNNVKSLIRNGISDPSEQDVYLAHNQGAAAAVALLRNKDENVVDALQTLNTYVGSRAKAELAIVQNGGSVSMTAGQFIAVLTARFSAMARRTPRVGTP